MLSIFQKEALTFRVLWVFKAKRVFLGNVLNLVVSYIIDGGFDTITREARVPY